jgi:transcription termination factor Rho
MPVLERDELEASPLADLHAIANQLGIDGFRRLRKAELVDAILGAPPSEGEGEGETEVDADAPAARGRTLRTRGGRTRGRKRAAEEVEEPEEAEDGQPEATEAGADADEESSARARRGTGRRRRSRASANEDRDADAGDEGEADERPARRERAGGGGEERVVEGVVELLGNGSAFLRVDPPEPSDNDVYVSAAQVRRCELVSGDRVSGPARAPRRSERYPSLVRVDTINGASADTVAEGTHYDDLPAAFPSERFALGAEDPTLRAIEWLTPIGRGSRVAIVGAARSGKTEALRRLAGALAAQDGLDVTLVLAGVRPEEIGEWQAGPLTPATAVSFAASTDAQGQAVERAVDTARRVAARGGNAVVLIDTLEGVHPPVARRALAAARNLVDGGSLTVIATSARPVGGETTVITLDVGLTSTGRLPALDLVNSGTLRPELLVGEAGAEAIAQARATALGAGDGA